MPPPLCPFSPQVLLTSMEEEMAAAKARRSLLDLFLVPRLRWRSCGMFLVRCVAPLVPPRARAGAAAGGVGAAARWGGIGGGLRPGPRAWRDGRIHPRQNKRPRSLLNTLRGSSGQESRGDCLPEGGGGRGL